MKKYIVKLEEDERSQLLKLTSSGCHQARKLTRARILLECDQAVGREWMKDREIAHALNVDDSTVERVRRKFVEEGFEACLSYKRRSDAGVPRFIDGDVEAHLIALACSPVPKGRGQWTLSMLADKMIELKYVETISYEAVRLVLKKKRAQTLAQEAVVHSARTKFPVRVPHGGHSRRLQAAL